MSMSNAITRLPRAWDPGLGEEAAEAVSIEDATVRQLLVGAAGSSPFLNRLIHREAEWLPSALEDPEAIIIQELRAIADLAPGALASGLRQAKRRIALLTALADLGGVWTLGTVMRVLSDFAGQAVNLAISSELSKLAERGKLPQTKAEDRAGFAGIVVLAMGKMGANELNYSSDIDLICLFDDALYPEAEVLSARQALIRVVRAVTSILSERSADGYVFRTDLRLRPDPSVSPVCLSISAAEQYYESFGRTWERAAMIKARPAAGDIVAGERFLEAIRPFIWRRHLDYAAIEDAHNIRQRIRDTKQLHGPLQVPGHDMKLGQGGIREIEFFAQTRQLIAGGRDPALRVRGTETALNVLSDKGWIQPDVSQRLIEHYRAYREIEHRIQMVHDAQTHKMPTSQEGLERVACLMGTNVDEMIHSTALRLQEVKALTEGFFAPDAGSVKAPIAHEFDTDILQRWSRYPAMRSSRAAQIFDRLRPDLLRRLSLTARPDEALLAFDGFLSGLPAGVQLFSMFEANPELVDLLIDIVGASPELANYLSRNASVLDAVIDGNFFAPWPGDDLANQLADRLTEEDDYERKLDLARRWKKEWHFRIGVHHLRGIINGEEAGRQYADLAGAVLVALWPVVVGEFARRHGAPPGRGATILGMGSLGGRHMNATSDLDVIVIYDSAGIDMSDGRRPLASRTYYARLTQALITAMTAPMAHGRLYDIDMRLRPSGNQGPVATSWPSFQNYQKDEAWLWEHLALTRAHVVTGPQDLNAEIEAFRAQIVGAKVVMKDVKTGVSDMRDRLAGAKPPSGWLDIRNGRGRLQSIELLAQAGHLISGRPSQSVADGLDGAGATGLLAPGDAAELAKTYGVFWEVHAAARLLGGQILSGDDLGENAARFLARVGGADDISALEHRLTQLYERTASIIDAALAQED